tara:strand:+ start:26 stop:511 length:486 start_codon:yes stop_codon:yes gene_type:complete
MAWKESTPMTQRQEFVMLASAKQANISLLWRRLGISRKTGYKWLRRCREAGPRALGDRSRRPHGSPNRIAAEVEQAVRGQHPAWGGRKIRCVRQRRKGRLAAMVPSASTITEFLRHHGLIDADESQKRQAVQRFEHPTPNDPWQMDFKGHFGMNNGNGAMG